MRHAVAEEVGHHHRVTVGVEGAPRADLVLELVVHLPYLATVRVCMRRLCIASRKQMWRLYNAQKLFEEWFSLGMAR